MGPSSGKLVFEVFEQSFRAWSCGVYSELSCLHDTPLVRLAMVTMHDADTEEEEAETKYHETETPEMFHNTP